MTGPEDRWRPIVGSVLLVLGVGAVVAGAFWVLDAYLGDMPSPLTGFLAGGALALVSVLRMWRDRREGR
ncbi:MAG: hypothetical protein ACOYXW_05545 [Actinomycetota bacterium]